MIRTALVALALLLSACRLLPQPAPEAREFLTLAQPVPFTQGRTPLVVGLGPVTLPGYLDQTSVVLRIDEERVTLVPGARWASPLPQQFGRALGLRLMDELGATDVVAFPWWPDRRIDVAVALTVVAFEVDTGGLARLDALWKLTGQKGTPTLGEGQVRVREPVESGGTGAAVAALDRALARLAAAIADDVRRVPR